MSEQLNQQDMPTLTMPAGIKKRGRPKKDDASKDQRKKSEHGVNEKGPRAKRSQAACQRCKTKKTKCDFVSGSRCCTRCAQDRAVCSMGTRKKVEFKQLPPGYAEVVEDNQLAMAETIISMFKELQNHGLWKHEQPRLDENGEPILHDIVTSKTNFSHLKEQLCTELHIDTKTSVPKNRQELEKLSKEIVTKNPNLSISTSTANASANNITSTIVTPSHRKTSHDASHLDHPPSPVASLISDRTDGTEGSPHLKAHTSPGTPTDDDVLLNSFGLDVNGTLQNFGNAAAAPILSVDSMNLSNVPLFNIPSMPAAAATTTAAATRVQNNSVTNNGRTALINGMSRLQTAGNGMFIMDNQFNLQQAQAPTERRQLVKPEMPPTTINPSQLDLSDSSMTDVLSGFNLASEMGNMGFMNWDGVQNINFGGFEGMSLNGNAFMA